MVAGAQWSACDPLVDVLDVVNRDDVFLRLPYGGATAATPAAPLPEPMPLIVCHGPECIRSAKEHHGSFDDSSNADAGNTVKPLYFADASIPGCSVAGVMSSA